MLGRQRKCVPQNENQYFWLYIHHTNVFVAFQRPCQPGSTCARCCSGHMADRCGKQHCLVNGTECSQDTPYSGTCLNCCDGSSEWKTKGGYACGEEVPDWPDGTPCNKTTTCHMCASGKHSDWEKLLSTGKPGHACGIEPCLPDGSPCPTLSCHSCCSYGKGNMVGRVSV